MIDRKKLKEYFTTGSKPTEAQFSELIDSFQCVGEGITAEMFSFSLEIDKAESFVFTLSEKDLDVRWLAFELMPEKKIFHVAVIAEKVVFHGFEGEMYLDFGKIEVYCDGMHENAILIITGMIDDKFIYKHLRLKK